MLREMAGTEHQILNHCPQSPAANLPLCRLLVPEGFLTNHPKEVESDHCQFQYQGIGSKLPRRKTLDIHTFDFIRTTSILHGYLIQCNDEPGNPINDCESGSK